MNKRLEEAQNKFVERIGLMSDAFGLNSFVTKIYALLYLSNKPLSLDEIAEALGSSKGNVSVNIRELENWGAARKIWIKGSRKDFYEANTDIKSIFLNKLRSSLQKRISEVSSVIEGFNGIIASINGELTAEEKKIVSNYKERIKKIEELKGLVSNAIVLANKLF